MLLVVEKMSTDETKIKHVSKNFNALKSGGGIHLFEKIAAENAKEYILLLPKERFKETLNPTISLCIEIIPNCLNNLMKKIPQGYTAKILGIIYTPY